MSLTAVEVREITDSITMQNFNKKIEETDEKIIGAANIGENFINSGIMIKKMLKAVQDYYINLGYDVVELTNHSLVISW